MQKKQLNSLMNSSNLIDQFSKYLFWDADVSKLDLNEYPAYVIQRVLEYGQMQDWKLINKIYGLPKIVEVCKGLRTLDPVCLSFICAISHTNKEDYRCYYTKHFSETLCNPQQQSRLCAKASTINCKRYCRFEKDCQYY